MSDFWINWKKFKHYYHSGPWDWDIKKISSEKTKLYDECISNGEKFLTKSVVDMNCWDSWIKSKAEEEKCLKFNKDYYGKAMDDPKTMKNCKIVFYLALKESIPY